MKENDRNNLATYSDDYLQTLEMIIESLPIPVSVVGNDEKFALVNSAYEKMFDIRREMLLGKHFSCNVKDGEDSIHRRVLQQKRPASGIKVMGNSQRLVKAEGWPVVIGDRMLLSAVVIHEFSATERAMSELEKRRELIDEVKRTQARYSFEDIIGSSHALQKTIETARKAAKTNVTVLLRGESGTGKELFAHAIHNESTRRNQKFIRVNCVAIPESLLESVLFGYEENSFTGAKRGGEIGLFEAANKGTIFLDEIGDISLALQSKLLRVLQEREVTKVGGAQPKIIDVRIIAATNVDLESRIANKEFRSDLYYRLNVFPVQIPPLREREGDIQELAEFFMRRYSVEFDKHYREMSSDCLRVLNGYPWPGNIRELDSVIARAVISSAEQDEIFRAKDIQFLGHQEKDLSVHFSVEEENRAVEYQELFQRWEENLLRMLYEEEGKNKTRLAKRLNLSVRSVYEKLKKYGIA